MTFTTVLLLVLLGGGVDGGTPMVRERRFRDPRTRRAGACAYAAAESADPRTRPAYARVLRCEREPRTEARTQHASADATSTILVYPIT